MNTVKEKSFDAHLVIFLFLSISEFDFIIDISVIALKLKGDEIKGKKVL